MEKKILLLVFLGTVCIFAVKLIISQRICQKSLRETQLPRINGTTLSNSRCLFRMGRNRKRLGTEKKRYSLIFLVYSIRIGRYIAESRLGRRSRWKIRASRPENIA